MAIFHYQKNDDGNIMAIPERQKMKVAARLHYLTKRPLMMYKGIHSFIFKKLKVKFDGNLRASKVLKEWEPLRVLTNCQKMLPDWGNI